MKFFMNIKDKYIMNFQKTSVSQLKSYAKDSHIRIPSELSKKKDIINHIKYVEQIRTHKKLIIFEEFESYKPTYRDYDLLSSYYFLNCPKVYLIIKEHLLLLDLVWRDRIHLNELDEHLFDDTCDCLVLNLQKVKDHNVQVIVDMEKEIKAYKYKTHMLSYRIQKANQPFLCDLSSTINRSDCTFQDVYELLKPGHLEKTDVYHRWEAIYDKQGLINLMFRVSGMDRSIKIDHLLDSILKHSTHPFFYDTDSRFYMIQSLIQTAVDLQTNGPYTTIKNKGDQKLKCPGADNELIWKDFMLIVLSFIKTLPISIQISWAENYMTSFIEGYDLKVSEFPNQVVVFGNSLVENKQVYPSCYLGMLYHTLISLYQTLFESHPDIQPELDPSTQKMIRRNMLSRLLQNCMMEYELEDPEEYKLLFKAYALSHLPDDNYEYDWEEMNIVIDLN